MFVSAPADATDALPPVFAPTMSSWSCPHDLDNVCQRVSGARCDPGMRGCVLHGRFRFARDEDGGVRKPVKAVADPPAAAPQTKVNRRMGP